MSNSNPSLDPADNDTLAGAFNFSIKKYMQNSNTMLPAQVVSYDRDTNRASAQLLINIVGTDGQEYARPQLASIPVFVCGGGGFRISFPVKPGDMGWVIANDRDISLFLSGYKRSAPNTARIKSFADGVFFPDAMTGLNSISPDDADNLVISNTSGSVTISLSSDGVTIKADKLNIDLGNPSNIVAVNGTINASGTINPGVPYTP